MANLVRYQTLGRGVTHDFFSTLAVVLMVHIIRQILNAYTFSNIYEDVTCKTIVIGPTLSVYLKVSGNNLPF